jgi:predicted RNA-binding protein with PIN domain
MQLILDGYNVIGVDGGLGGGLETKRNRLLQQLSAYQSKKKVSITVVFDGWRSGGRTETIQKKDGVTVVYSRLDEKADSVIIRMTRPRASGTVVITSDREVRSAVERLGAATVLSEEFIDILHEMDGPRQQDIDDSDDFGAQGRARSKGGSRSTRRRSEALRKLRF